MNQFYLYKRTSLPSSGKHKQKFELDAYFDTFSSSNTNVSTMSQHQKISSVLSKIVNPIYRKKCAPLRPSYESYQSRVPRFTIQYIEGV